MPGLEKFGHATQSTTSGTRSADKVAAYLGIAPRLVRAALEYYTEFPDEADEDAAAAAGRVEQGGLCSLVGRVG